MNTDLEQQAEGLKCYAYQDQGGIWTLGYGTTVYSNGLRVKEGDTCTPEQALAWLQDELGLIIAKISQEVTVPLTENQVDAIGDFIYNLGNGAFLSSTLLRKLNAGDYAGASLEFDKWDRVGAVECAGLLRRREEEKALFDSGMKEA